MEKGIKFSSCERFSALCKHVSLTHYMRHNWAAWSGKIMDIIARCDVSPFVGELPPELRARVPRAKISQYTAKFHDILDTFIVEPSYFAQNAR